MTLIHPNLRAVLAATIAFVAALGDVHAPQPRATRPTSPAAKSLETGPPARTTDQQIAKLQATIRAGLGGRRRLRKPRQRLPPEGSRDRRSDVLPEGAGRVRDRADASDPHNISALSGMGTLALARHQFRLGLRYGLHSAPVRPARARRRTS